ncbi:BTAD domain-containing putative transcriptional regulator [Actinoplanes sp. NPDC051513]|uniref:AfsR/SARP family transcriptional regulator n=1 Tax=Actinoplanes sp. NPDC051513 TaxID=3363908 RepID=UPI003789004C
MTTAIGVGRPPGKGGVRLEFRLLGPLEVVGDAGLVQTVGTRLPAVLATLLLHANRTVTVGRLAHGVWQNPASGANSNIRTYVAQLRAAFAAAGQPPARLLTETGGYRLAVADGELDVASFEALAQAGEHALRRGDPGAAQDLLQRAKDLWRGEALAGLTAGRFLQAEAARLDWLRLSVMAMWADAALAAGRHEAAVAELTRLVSVQPLCEQTWAKLMLALYRCGRRAEALAAYQRAYRLLDQQLGLVPGRPLQQLQRQVLAADPVLDP